MDGDRAGLLGQLVRPLDTVAAYIPSGRYPLPSTILMTVVPAQVAGVPNICVASPKPVAGGLRHGGDARGQATCSRWAARRRSRRSHSARGRCRAPTASSGPGNIYVAAAKKLLAGEVGIDFVAGPTEILIISGGRRSAHLAADMLAQAEHDVDASAVLLTTSKRLADGGGEGSRAAARDAADGGRGARRRSRRTRRSCWCGQLEEAVELSNRFAPEHLSIPDASLLPGIRHAGSVFVGPYSPEAAGDYASGPNHVLPTSGAARVRGGLSVTDYVKVISVQELTPKALAELAPAITTLARAEGWKRTRARWRSGRQ